MKLIIYIMLFFPSFAFSQELSALWNDHTPSQVVDKLSLQLSLESGNTVELCDCLTESPEENLLSKNTQQERVCLWDIMYKVLKQALKDKPKNISNSDEVNDLWNNNGPVELLETVSGSTKLYNYRRADRSSIIQLEQCHNDNRGKWWEQRYWSQDPEIEVALQNCYYPIISSLIDGMVNERGRGADYTAIQKPEITYTFGELSDLYRKKADTIRKRINRSIER